MWLIIYYYTIIIILSLGQGQGKGDTKGEDIIHHNLLRGGGATHNHLNTKIEGKEQLYYYKHVIFCQI